jgi:hypothetical protein
MERQSLLRELRTILADYVQRIERAGAEALRLPGEPRADWVRKRKQIQRALKVLEKVASEARDSRELLAILAEPRRLAAAAEKNLESLRRRVAAMDEARLADCASDCRCRVSEIRRGPNPQHRRRRA